MSKPPASMSARFMTMSRSPRTCMPSVHTSALPRMMPTNEGKAQRVRAAVLGHRQPILPAVSERAVVDEHARAAGPDNSCPGLHHRPGGWQRPAGAAQDDVHRVGIDGRQLVNLRRLPAGGPKYLGKLIIGCQCAELDLRGVRQDQ